MLYVDLNFTVSIYIAYIFTFYRIQIKMIHHITTITEWEEACAKGAYAPPSLTSEGFIHCSTLSQTVNTANSFFKGKTDLVLLCIDEMELSSECRYEPPVIPGYASTWSAFNEECYPHVYGPITLSAIREVFDFQPDENGEFHLPTPLTEHCF